MKSIESKFPLCKLAIAISSCFLSYSIQATSLLTVTASTTEGGVTYSESDDNTDNDDSVSAYSLNAVASANTEGVFGVETSTMWNMQDTTSTASVSIIDTITNDSGVDGTFSFDFIVDEGSIDTLSWASYYDDEYTTSGYSVSIIIDGIVEWETSLSLYSDTDGITYSQTGNNLAYDYDYDSIEWDEQSFSIDLGYLASSESFEIEYLVEAYSIVELNNDEWNYGGSAVNFSDPYSLTGTPVFSSNSLTLTSTSSSQSVPEPATLLLLGAGVAGLAGSRRKKQKKASI